LAEHIILTLNVLRKAIKSPHFTFLLAILSSYFLSNALSTETNPSHLPLPSLIFFTVVLSSHSVGTDESGLDGRSQLIDSIEELGGDGPRVAAYLRISKKKFTSFSLAAQRDAMNKLKNDLKPSKIYWFIDDGKSSKSPEDFDKLKISSISKLRETKEIQELWVFNVDRIGRVCRKLLYFFLEFCDDGGTIRTPDKAYNMEDLASIITFVLEAHAAEKANKNRRAAAIAGKARAFKQKRWNKPVPLGYQKEGWLQKQTEFAPLIREVHQLLLTWENLESVRKRLGNFTTLLTKPLTRSQIRRILSDPVYIGKPEHLGEVVIDPDLAFIDEGTSQKSLEVLAKIQERCKPRRMGPLEKLAASRPITFLQVLETFELHHRGCGGVVWKNGTTHDEGPWQQLFRCKKCETFWRLPPINPNQGKHQAGIFNNDSMGGLNFDNQSPLALKKHNARKGNDGSSDPIRQRLPKSERHFSSTSGKVIGLDLLGHPINDYPRCVKRNQKSPSRIVRKKSNISPKEQDLGQFLVQAKQGYG
jgi:DNA invertase Pin-like site-specific DNA recombinase